MSTALIITIALAIDFLLGEPKRYHPLVEYGKLVDFAESRLNKGGSRKLLGVLAWCLVVIPFVILFAWLDSLAQSSDAIGGLVAAFILYLSVGWQSLIAHARAVIKPLKKGKIDAARLAVSKIVSRDVDQLDESGIAKAATESVLENGCDAIFASIFWFCLFGIPGVILYRLSNTLDAMWGYKNERFTAFGWAAARIDDGLNFIPACLTALSYAVIGDSRSAYQHWRSQAFRWKSFNAGTVMAAGAGALNVTLGGDDIYQGELQKRPLLGPEFESDEFKPTAKKLKTACELVNGSLVVWFLVIVFVETML